MTSTAAERLLLVGAGHAHLELLRRGEELRKAGYEVSLLAPSVFRYSGMASAVATGEVAAERACLDVHALARRGGVRHTVGEVSRLDLEAGRARSAHGEVVDFDVVSFNVGSAVATSTMQVDESVLRAKPLAGLHELAARLTEGSAGARRITVVGGGSSGLELAAHLAVHPAVARVRLLEARARIGTDLPPGARRRVGRVLERRGVEVRTDVRVHRLAADRTELADGTEIEHDLAVLATGLVAAPIIRELGLASDHEDGVPVRATLQHRDHDHVYAAGDCALFLPDPLPRVGVHGVRQGPVLLASLLARRLGDPLPTYAPQRRALSVLDLGDGQGLAVRGGLWWHGRSAHRLKRRIDDRWLRRYREDG